jgi:NitT/TauT family transport system substrate-binding protein
MRRKIGSILLAGLLTATFTFGMSPREAAAEKVTILMDWIFGAKHVGFFVARDKGLFKKGGLDVKILKGRGSGRAASSIDTRQVEYSYGDFATMIRAVSKGAKNVAVGAGHVFQTGGYIFFAGSGIKTPKDLEGKRFGTTATDFGLTLLPAMAAASDFDSKKVTVKIMKVAVRTPALFEGKIDFISGTRGSSIPRMAVIAKRRGKTAKYLYFKDMGLDTYGHVVQTHRDRIKNNPKQVQRVVSAIFDAWAWSIKNPKESFEVFMKANPEKDREISQAQIGEGLSDVQDKEVMSSKGLGYMKGSLVEKSVGIANKYFKLSPAVDYKKTYTNQFIRPNPGM